LSLGTQLPVQKLTQPADLVGRRAARLKIRNRLATGECAHERNAISDTRSNGLSELRQFFQELPPLQGSAVHPVWHVTQRFSGHRLRTVPKKSSVRAIPSRSKPDGVQGSTVRCEIAIGAITVLALGALSTTRYSAATVRVWRTQSSTGLSSNGIS
jgi:hypothetical protein